MEDFITTEYNEILLEIQNNQIKFTDAIGASPTVERVFATLPVAPGPDSLVESPGSLQPVVTPFSTPIGGGGDGGNTGGFYN